MTKRRKLSWVLMLASACITVGRAKSFAWIRGAIYYSDDLQELVWCKALVVVDRLVFGEGFGSAPLLVSSSGIGGLKADLENKAVKQIISCVWLFPSSKTKGPRTRNFQPTTYHRIQGAESTYWNFLEITFNVNSEISLQPWGSLDPFSLRAESEI